MFTKKIPGVQPAKVASRMPKAADAPDRLGEMPDTAAGLPKGKLADPKALRQRLIAKLRGGL